MDRATIATMTFNQFVKWTRTTLHNGQDHIPASERHDPFYYAITGQTGTALDGFRWTVYRVRDDVHSMDDARRFAWRFINSTMQQLQSVA